MKLIYTQNFIKTDSFGKKIYVIGRENRCGYPPAPLTIFGSIPKNADIVYKIFSIDISVSPSGNAEFAKLSEKDALKLASAKIYEDKISCSCYFRYLDGCNQHTVWLEDFFHTAAKLFYLKKLGFENVYIAEDEYSAPTVSKLFAAYGNRI